MVIFMFSFNKSHPHMVNVPNACLFTEAAMHLPGARFHSLISISASCCRKSTLSCFRILEHWFIVKCRNAV